MDAVLAVAVEKLVGKLKGNIPVGVHQVEDYVTLHISGEVKKFEDETYIPTASVPLKPTLAILLHLMGFQRDKAAEILIKAMEMALSNGTDATNEMQEYMSDVDTCMEKVEALAAKLPPQKRAGKTTVKGKVEVVPAAKFDKAI